MLRNSTIPLVLAFFCAGAAAQTVTYRQNIKPLVSQLCSECHGSDAPTLAEFKLDEERYTKAKKGPRTDSYETLLQLIVYTDTGALMRRLDDGENHPEKKPGNMFKYLGDTAAERTANLAIFKSWVGEGGWNLNRWAARGNVPAITKEQLERLQLKY